MSLLNLNHVVAFGIIQLAKAAPAPVCIIRRKGEKGISFPHRRDVLEVLFLPYEITQPRPVAW
jgi:hypothetical protein